MGVSLYTQEQRKDFAEKAKALLEQSEDAQWSSVRREMVEKAKAYIALAQL